jgi:uncharacterized pyridoxamine 5'-phosphate oxidase family protein
MSVLLGTELNGTLMDLFDKRINTAIVATTDQSNNPHIAPFHFIVARDPKHLRVAVSRHHLTYLNMIENGHVAISVLDEGDIAVSIKGLAQVIKNSMESDYNMAVVEIEVTEIKKDNSPSHFVFQGTRIRHKSEPNLLNSRKIFQELSH